MTPTRLFRFYALNDVGDTITVAILRAWDESDAVTRGFRLLTPDDETAILRALDGDSDPEDGDAGSHPAFFTADLLARHDDAADCASDMLLDTFPEE